MQKFSSQPIYGIGIDTGGTYTDAVLVDLRSHAVLGVGKRPTMHHNLGQGIVDVLNDILSAKNTGCIKTIAFSTTLATNASAEGRGAKVGLMVIGQVKPFDAPVVSVHYLDGGHDHLGREVNALSIERIVDTVLSPISSTRAEPPPPD
ncbi:hypothetical protein DSCO28_42240 [Desulfosarcina ovata subsp. sediminis]|uniref:Hydantoinase/oxoprolinase N-terminal domain-containing protein n=1 Tax=Desulfosarcina ovata subsp. sediminis TaxID=885957 RepID=A0A5K7ZTY1_9BACT|nr:hydantoinase/oxoprolinase N-terminal domain-containing protein [Desulfosarcina ovata]BBO83658.1 hypothetical protein DSCO28_42240 [Desulfosarcina ovata subsp. sediminis]